MNNKKIIKGTLLFFGIALSSFGFTQESVHASGGNATGSGGTVNYSVGQVVYTTNNSSEGSVAQGVQHAYQITNVSINEKNSNISLTVFPNPTSDFLNLQIENFNDETRSYQISDTQGKIIGHGNIVTTQTQIGMHELPRAVYYIHVLDNQNQIIQSFQIIKN